MLIRHSRRSFLKRGMALAGASMAAAHWRSPYVLAQPAPGAKLGVAVVGAGGMGSYSLGCALGERLVALVDVDENIIAGAMKEVKKRQAGAPDPKIFFDYRKMLDECHKDLDAVLIATPDHNHAPAAIRAINLGKATFAQKPLAHNVRECYVLGKAAKEHKVPTQMGNQGHCSEGIRRLVECIWAGAVGNVKESHTILGRNFGGTGGRPKSKPVPKGVHWDEWLGPAPYRDYHDGLHTFSWRSWRDFGTATIGDMACHHLDGPFWALKLNEAKQFTVECVTQKGGSKEMYTQDNILRWEFPARGDMPPVTVYAYDHDGLKPEVMRNAERENNRKFGEFTLYVGDKGLIGSDARILPEAKHQQFTAPPKSIPRALAGGPVEELFHVIRHGGTCCSNFIDSGGPLAAFVLTGLLAEVAGAGKKLEWDVENMKCTNLPEINKYVGREYRQGWEV